MKKCSTCVVEGLEGSLWYESRWKLKLVSGAMVKHLTKREKIQNVGLPEVTEDYVYYLQETSPAENRSRIGNTEKGASLMLDSLNFEIPPFEK